MKIHRDLHHLPKFRNAVITIGSFDGVHRGHQKLVERVRGLAREAEGESVVVTFHPHPRQVVYPKDDTLKLLSTVEEKIALLERYGVDHVVIVPFTVEFSQQSADEYIEKFLVEKFHPKYIVVGYDHRFGLNRQGDINYLRWHGEKFDYKVVEIEQQEVEDIAVSSTKIRKALDAGQVGAAQQLLGHYYTLIGEVTHGQKIGTSLGFPTANLIVPQREKLVPPDGIYAVWVTHNGQRYGGMLYIGSRPTLKKYNNRTIEVNIFEFDKNIYGDELTLELVEFIRHDSQFTDLEGLKRQLAMDRKRAKELLLSVKEAPTKTKVAVVILNYNGASFLAQFLPTVLACSESAEVIVADNGSSDGSVAFLRENYPDVQILEIPENLGFAGGYNEALRRLAGDWEYYVLLNSDVEVTPHWLDPLLALLEADKTVAACQPKIRAQLQKECFEYAGAAGGWLDALGYPFCRGRMFAVTEKDEGQYDEAQEIFWATGAALAIRAELFHAMGGFDTDYFAHLEEIDLCWRLKRAGYKIMAEPKSMVYHVGGGTLSYNTPNKAYLNFRNSLYTLMKNESAAKLWWLISLRLVLDGLAAILFMTEGKWQHIRSIIRAHWTFFPNIGKILRKRRETERLVEKNRIGRENNSGRYAGSIVWQYYALGQRHFKNLK